MGQFNRFGLPLVVAAVMSAVAFAQPATNTVTPACAARQGEKAAAVRIATDWRSSPPVLVTGNAKASVGLGDDLGVAPAGIKLSRMLLVLEPSPTQQQALDTFLADQQHSGSCAYHRWLTPSQFADAFANSAADVNAVVAWLENEEFEVAAVPAGRGWVEFSGTTAQVERAFGTEVRRVATAAGPRFVLAGNISVPGALRPMIHGLASLDGALATAAMTKPQTVSASASELSAAKLVSDAEALTPGLMAQMLHVDALHTAGTKGAGETIAIAARSNVGVADVDAFRSIFGLGASALVVKPNGADPGWNGDQAAAEFAAQWAGAAAPGAQIVVAPAATTNVTDGVDLSLASIVDGVAAHTVVVGFSACEAGLSEAHRAFYSTLYRQAAAEGMSVIAAAGDSGASACHLAGSDAPVTTGYAVNALAATPWNVAVGAAGLASTSTADLTGWSTAGSATAEYAGGGGRSSTYALPAWQPAVNASAMKGGVSAYALDAASASSRILPDMVLPTAIHSSFSRGMVFCFSETADAQSCPLVRSGGSGAAAAIFAGISALLAEKYGAQGNMAPELYALRNQSGVFTDVQQGSARLACVADSPGCDASGQIGYDATSGFDLATGLGSPNAEKLFEEWAKPAATGTGGTNVVLAVTPVAQNNTYNPSATITFTATVASQTGGAVPTGTVTFSDVTPSGTIPIGGSAVTLDSTGKATATVSTGLAIGGNNVTAIYSGDSTYAAASSTPPFVVTIAKSQTSLAITAPSAVAAGSSFTVTVTVTASTPPAGSLPPGGSMVLAVDGVTAATATLATTAGVTTATFTVTAPTANLNHNLQASYPGDGNYASSVATVPFSISKGATATTLSALPAVLTPGATETLTATVTPAVASTTAATITGTVSFYDGTALLGTATLTANSASLTGVALSAAKTHVITAIYSGDTNWATSTSNAVSLVANLLADTVTLTVNPSPAAPGQVVTLIATVTPAVAPLATAEQNPTGNILFYDGTTILATVALTAGPNNTATATLLSAKLPAGSDVLYAFYVGDSFYMPGTSNSVALAVQDFTIVPSSGNSPTNLNIIKGNSGSASFVVSALGGYAGQINVVCTVPTQDDMTCSPASQQVTPTGTVTFTVQTYLTGGTTTAARHHPPLWPRTAGGTALAGLFLFLLPMGRGVRQLREGTRRALMLALLLVGVCGLGTGCQSVSGGASGAVGSGTPLGVATLTITGASYINNTVVSHSVFLTVNVLPVGSTAATQSAAGAK